LAISLLGWISAVIQAQCDKTLVQKATELTSKDAVLVRNFKVKLKEGDKRNPSPSSKFSVLMQKDILYRFNVVGALENAEDAVLQLYDKSNLLGSTFDFDKGADLNNFSYQCPRTGDYQVIVTFRKGRAGCAAGVMSMVVDSAFLSSHNPSDETDENVLYLGISNHLEVSTDSLGDDKLELTIDNGIINYKRGNYSAMVERGNTAKITVKRKSRDGKVVEEIVKQYKVVPLPEPKIRLEGIKSDYINSFDLTAINKLEIKPSVYRIVEFYISSYQTPYSGYRSDDEFLTYDQRDFLKNLYAHNRFYIHDIKVERPDGTIMMVKTVEYFVR